MFDWKSLLAYPLLKWILLPLLAIAGAAFYKWAPWIKQDNVLEEKLEEIIKDKTGVDIDLSPESKEESGKDK